MKKFLSAILIIFVFSMINLPNYVKPEKAYAVSNEITKKDFADLDTALNTLTKLQQEYNKLDKSKKTIWVEAKKKAVKKLIDNEIIKIEKLIKTKVIPAVQKTVNDIKTFIDLLKGIHEDIKGMIEAIDQCNKAMDEINKTLNEQVKTVDEINDIMVDMNKTYDKMNKEVDKMNKDVLEMQRGIDEANRGFNQMNGALTGLNKAMDKTNSNLKAANSNMKQMTKSVDKINSGVTHVSISMNNVNNSLDKLNKNLDTVNKTKINYNYHYYSSDGSTTKKLNTLNQKRKKVEDSQKNIKKIDVEINNVSHYDTDSLRKTQRFLSFTADLIPILSNLKSGSEAITGKDLISQKELSSFDRTVAVLSVVGGDATKVTGKLAGTVSKTNKSAKYVESSVKAKKVLNSFTEVSDFVAKNGRLPVNYITKGEARKLGWDSKKGNLSKVAPGKSIGGDIYKNREKLLPEAKNRVWREADINYTTGYRGNDRLLYSNDGLIYKTTDHYKTFVKLK
ncbi:ribonuclease domain-containing protein [Bacillus sp. SN1]|uniref:ribonuclease domain-containing protein n=1 Tax=Bacillus sp. SN1 TaxID=2055158 RepID=UPI000C228C9E|nr:ribonuclease domain-containing protein [Bacillus sp. SN1]PJH93062.1 hypothetical protein CVV77_14045 [Bacillus sp. SN1]